MAFVDRIKERAKTMCKTILLPETMDDRTYYAAEGAIKEGLANIVLIGSQAEIDEHVKATGVDISKATIVDPATYEKFNDYANLLYETRKAKGMTEEQAKEILLKDTITFGIVMLKAGDADGLVAGACHSTADTLRPSLQILKTKAGSKLFLHSSLWTFQIVNMVQTEHLSLQTLVLTRIQIQKSSQLSQLHQQKALKAS